MYRQQLRERQRKLHAKLAVMRQERDARITAHTEEEARARALVAGLLSSVYYNQRQQCNGCLQPRSKAITSGLRSVAKQ
jgi:hypothetical protein